MNEFGCSYLPDLQAVTQSGLIPGEKLLQLNCLRLGDPADNIFPIKIGDNNTVGTLKKSIKEEKVAFQDIDADTLTVWNISISVEMLQTVALDQLLKKEEPLRPIQVLSDVFPNTLDRNQLHVVVMPPGKCTN